MHVWVLLGHRVRELDFFFNFEFVGFAAAPTLSVSTHCPLRELSTVRLWC